MLHTVLVNLTWSSAYYNGFLHRFPNTWTHGDYIMINSKTGGITMLGRSDGTLNPSGVRFGSSEIYSVGKYSKSFLKG